MSDEIDIEEHDLMDNPRIKRIFPDLSVIKKEINRYDYDEDLILPSELAPLVDLGQGDTISKDSKGQLTNDTQNRNEHFTTSPFHEPEAQAASSCLYENIIILGTKPNLESQENIPNSLGKEPKIILKNVNSFLNRCKRYCNICLILFPKANIFNLHMINVHTKRNKQQIAYMGRQDSNKVFKCNACDKILSSKCNLWRHFRNLHGDDVKAFKIVDRSDNKTVANEAAESKAITGPSCFHCQQLFPNQSSLIEHLYEVLDPNKIGNSDRSTNLRNAKEPDKEFNHNDRLIDDERVKQLNESNISYEDNLVINSRPHSHNKVDTDNDDSESILPQINNPRRRSLDSVVGLAEYGDKNIKTTKRTADIDLLQNKETNLRKRIKLKKYNEFTEQFNSKEELKYHEKSIHREQSNKTNKNKLKPRKKPNHLIFSKESSCLKFYKCLICSKYNVTFEFYCRHIMSDHNIKEVTEVKKVPFDSQCKFCPSKLSGIYSYNVHLFKNHKEHLKQAYFPREEQPINTNQEKVDKKNHFALKNILYKCMKCDLYFLSSNAAMDHLKHLEIAETWKCGACQRMFRRENMVLHEKQHSFSQTFTVHTLTESAFSRILYRCSNCTVHYSEENFFLHYLKCDSETPNSLYCKVCDIIINRDDMESHQINHKEKNIAYCDFIIIEPDMIDDRHINTNTNKKKNNKSKMIDERLVSPKASPEKKNKCDIMIDERQVTPNTATKKKDKTDVIDEIHAVPNTATKKKDKSDMIDEIHIAPNTATKKKDKSDMIDEIHVAPNTATKKKDKSDKIDEIHVAPNTATKKKDKSDMKDDRNITLNTTNKKKDQSDMIGDRYRRPNRTKTKNNIVKRYEKSRFGNESLVEYSRLAMSFCHTCKCFIGNMNLRKLHVDGKCGHMLKLVCKGCGLLLTTKTHETHKENHRKQQISLHDYSFYDLKTEKRICPPIPEYPKCTSCGVHFLRNSDVRTHSCQEQDYITCNVCFIKLTEHAYKLHIHFHSYSIPNVKTKLKDTALQANTANKISYVDTSSNVSDDPYTTDVFYTCKSCQLTVKTYDKVVQHCHDHYNSEVVKLYTQKCKNCTLILERSDYKSHLNGKCNNDSMKVVDFDPFYFSHNNDFWTKHIFAYVADEDISKILRNSIYRYECRLKMEKIQSGSTNSVLYKCDKCQVFIDPQHLYIHAVNSRDKSCVKLRKHPCALCGSCFSSIAYRTAHEKDHESIEMNLKSQNIVLYNKEEHESYNKIMYDSSDRYILYQCRNCESVVDKFDRYTHNCDENNLKLCSTCGLLFDKQDFDLHFIRHEELEQFNIENMIVIMFGIQKPCYIKKLSSTFSGTKYDFTMYKCKKCDLCLKTKKCVSEHVCVFDNSKCKCSKCGLYFSELDYKYHYEIHESNLDFDDLSMNMITVDPSPANLPVDPNEKMGDNSGLVKQSEEVLENTSSRPEKQEIIYKSDCGLHFLEEPNAQQHAKNCKCNTRLKVSKQTCNKCDLLFTPGELFNHLLRHHCDKKLQFKFDIVTVSTNVKK